MWDIVGSFLGTIFGFLLRPLYALISYSYEMIVTLASVNFFGGIGSSDLGWFESLVGRIYILLGIFMLFRLGFSILQYIVNPDKMSDQKLGIGNIVKRTVIALIVLVLFQPAVKFAMDFQQVVLEDNVLGRIILGSTNVPDEYQENFGEIFAHTLVTTMTTLQEEWVEENPACEGTLSVNVIKETNNQGCIDAINTSLTNSGSEKTFEELMNPADQSYLWWFSSSVLFAGYEFLDGEENKVLFDTNWILLLIVGIVFIWLLLSIGLQVAVRVIKLAFLVLIAPIPIISYIEPGAQKNIFGMWAKELGTTYAMLFVRLAALYFAVLIVLMVSDTIGAGALVDYQGAEVTDNVLVSAQLKLVLFIAAFLFADQLPKMIENIFGIKSEGGMFKSPFRQMRESKSLMGTAGRVAGTGLSAASLFRPGGKLSALKKELTSGATALKGKSFKDKASFAMTQAGKAATLAGSLSRGGRDISKHLQDNQNEGFVEGVKDAQKQNEKRINNRLNRQAQDEWGVLMGKDLQLENEKGRLEKERQAYQLQKDKIDEKVRIDSENAANEKSLKAALGDATDFAEKEIEIKNKTYADHLKRVEAAKAVAEDSQVKLNELETERARLQGMRGIAEQEIADLSKQKLTTTDAELAAQLDAKIKSKTSEIDQLEGSLRSLQNNIDIQQNVVTKAQVEYADLDGNTSNVKDEIVQAAIRISMGKGSAQDRALAAGVDDAKLRSYILGMEGKFKEYKEYLNRRGSEIESNREALKEQEESLETLRKELSPKIAAGGEEGAAAERQLKQAESDYVFAEKQFKDACRAYDEGVRAISIAEESKNNLGYYTIDDVETTDDNGNSIVVKGIKSGFKALERIGIELESSSKAHYGTETRELDAQIKDLSNKIAEKEKEIRDVREKTKGVGIADETWEASEMSSFNNGSGPGASQ